MGKTVNMEAKQQVETPQPEMKTYEYGDLTVGCKCGHTQVVDKAIKGGISIPIPTCDERSIELVCEECGSSLKLYFTESSKEDIQARKQLEIKKEEDVKAREEALKNPMNEDVEVVDSNEDAGMTEVEMVEKVKEALKDSDITIEADKDVSEIEVQIKSEK